jgi:3-methyladenine DNA glycosylase/8-oxoguanine DNA glycosylase
MNDDRELRIHTALADLAHRSPVLAALIATHGPFQPRRTQSPDLFAALARAILYQQLAGRAASAIHGRFVALFADAVSPSAVLAMDPEHIRSAGLSRAKRDAVVDLARYCHAGELELAVLEGLDDEALTKSLCRVRGIGPWTAHMFQLFELGRLDVWPVGDLAVRRGFGRAFEQPTPTARALGPAGDPFRPYRSIVAWYCWRVMDTAAPDRPSQGG